jgi:hypothetical protein
MPPVSDCPTVLRCNAVLLILLPAGITASQYLHV